jgi:hypothetical protein
VIDVADRANVDVNLLHGNTRTPGARKRARDAPGPRPNRLCDLFFTPSETRAVRPAMRMRQGHGETTTGSGRASRRQRRVSLIVRPLDRFLTYMIN